MCVPRFINWLGKGLPLIIQDHCCGKGLAMPQVKFTQQTAEIEGMAVEPEHGTDAGQET
jgi:hypothetical protein